MNIRLFSYNVRLRKYSFPLQATFMLIVPKFWHFQLHRSPMPEQILILASITDAKIKSNNFLSLSPPIPISQDQRVAGFSWPFIKLAPGSDWQQNTINKRYFYHFGTLSASYLPLNSMALHNLLPRLPAEIFTHSGGKNVISMREFWPRAMLSVWKMAGISVVVQVDK